MDIVESDDEISGHAGHGFSKTAELEQQSVRVYAAIVPGDRRGVQPHRRIPDRFALGVCWNAERTNVTP
jgi:hypothetical protein